MTLHSFIEHVVPAILSAITIYMNLLAGNKNPKAWAVGLVGQLGWLIWILASFDKNWGFLPMNIALWVVYGRNHFKWNKKPTTGENKLMTAYQKFDPTSIGNRAELDKWFLTGFQETFVGDLTALTLARWTTLYNLDDGNTTYTVTRGSEPKRGEMIPCYFVLMVSEKGIGRITLYMNNFDKIEETHVQWEVPKEKYERR